MKKLSCLVIVFASVCAFAATAPIGTSTTSNPAKHGTSHGAGGTDPVTVSQGQVAGLISALSNKEDRAAFASFSTATQAKLNTKQPVLSNAAALSAITASGDGTQCLKNNGTYGACGTGGGDVSGKLDVATFNSYTSAGRATEQYVNGLATSAQTFRFSDAATTLRVGIWSDIHYRDANGDVGEQAILADMKNNSLPIDVLFSAGDNGSDANTRFEDTGEWEAWRQRYITGNGILWQSAIGNHDSFSGNGQAQPYSSLIAEWQKYEGTGYPGTTTGINVFVWNDIAIVTLGLDNFTTTGSVLPSDPVLNDLEYVLGKLAGKKVFVISHHPPKDVGLNSSPFGPTGLATYGATNTRIKTICQTYHPLGWFTGHIHYHPTSGDPLDVLTASPADYGGTKFYGVPAMRGGVAAWVYFAINLGDNSVSVRFRNSTTAAWLTQWDTTITLPSPVSAGVASLPWGHSHKNKAQLDALADAGSLTLSTADIAGGGTVTLENTDSTTAAHSPGFTIINYRGSQTSGTPLVLMQTANGSKASPTAVNSTNTLGSLRIQGHDGTSFSTAASWEIVPEGTWGGSYHQAYHRWLTRASGESAAASKMRLTSDGNLLVGLGTLTNTNNSKLKVDGDIETTTGIRFPSGLMTAPPVIKSAAGAYGTIQASDGSGNFIGPTDLVYTGTLTVGGDAAYNGTIRLAVKQSGGTVVSYLHDDGTIYGKKLGLGVTSPTGNLDVYTNDGTGTLVSLRDEYTTATGGGGIHLRHSNGTGTYGADTGAYAKSGDILGTILFGSRNGASLRNGARIVGIADGDHTTTAAGTYLKIQTAPTTTTTAVDRFVWASDGRIRYLNQPAAPASNHATCTSGDVIHDFTNRYTYYCHNGGTDDSTTVRWSRSVQWSTTAW